MVVEVYKKGNIYQQLNWRGLTHCFIRCTYAWNEERTTSTLKRKNVYTYYQGAPCLYYLGFLQQKQSICTWCNRQNQLLKSITVNLHLHVRFSIHIDISQSMIHFTKQASFCFTFIFLCNPLYLSVLSFKTEIKNVNNKYASVQIAAMLTMVWRKRKQNRK